jgi:hypothetical protein
LIVYNIMEKTEYSVRWQHNGSTYGGYAKTYGDYERYAKWV